MELPGSGNRTFKRAVALVGSCAHWRNAPIEVASLETWTVGCMYRFLPRITRYYDLHCLEWRREHSPDQMEWMAKVSAEGSAGVYLLEKHDDLPHCLVPPKDEIVSRFGQYIRSSMDWMLLHYLLEIEKSELDYADCYLGVWGVDMTADDEYGYQKPSFESWLKYAEGRGMKVWIPPESDLFKSRGVYGAETNGAFAHKIKVEKQRLQEMKAKAESERDIARAEGFAAAGGLTALTRIASELNGTCPEWVPQEIELLQKGLELSRIKTEGQQANVNRLEGALEHLRWVSQYA